MHTVEHNHRQAILDAADRMFLRHGYRRTTIEDIARDAGIGKGTVYLHFSRKEEIGSAWFKQWHERILVAMQSKSALMPNSREKVQAALHQRVLCRYDALEKWDMSILEIVDSVKPLVVAHRAEFLRDEADFLAELLAVGVDNGAFRNIDPERVSESMLIATNGLLPYTVRPEEIGRRDVVERQTDELIELLLQAIDPPRRIS